MELKKDISMETIVYLILIGIAAGFLGGMVGIGGGVIIVPALVLLLGITQHNAQGISLAMMLFPVGILGVINYYKKGYVDFKYAGLIAAGFLLGSYLGSKFSLSLPQDTVKKIFAIVMIILAVRMLLTGKK
ncbi:MAG: sulfite exporter TauE/SafE family protein [Bacteroidota bacterium]|jgi:uncharacterized membrane protein YfcA